MKNMRIFPLISCFFLVLYFLIFSFSDSIAEPATRGEKCISCCTDKQLVCLNLNPDRRLCAAEFENCVATCKSEGAVSSEWSDCWSRSGL
jgi:hypothetical protein